MHHEIETVPCKLCGNPTTMLGTKLCNSCYEMTKCPEVRTLVRAAQGLVANANGTFGGCLSDRIGRDVLDSDFKAVERALEPFTEK